jgi:hypothetical protein
MSDSVSVSSVNLSSSEQENHEASNHKNWIEVNSKHRNNLYSCRKRNSAPVKQSILTSNNYAQLSDHLGTPHTVGKSSWGLAHRMSLTELALLDSRRPLPLWDVIGLTLTLTLINLQYPTVNANDAKTASELGLLYNLQSEDRQSELVNAEEKSNYHIPVILNGKLRSKVVKESVNCANKRNPRLVNEVLVNNLPLTGNLGLQTPNKSKSRVTILSDSHLKGCTMKINTYLSDKFRTVGWIKTGTLTKKMLDKPTVDLVNLKKSDVIVLSAGALRY